jgi:hypothetical protein
MAACKARYGKNVSRASSSSDGKRLNCHTTSDDPIFMRDACKKRYGPWRRSAGIGESCTASFHDNQESSPRCSVFESLAGAR